MSDTGMSEHGERTAARVHDVPVLMGKIIERRLLLEIPDDKMDRIEKRASRGREMAPKNKKGFRHRVQSLVLDKRDPSQIIRTLAPVDPRLKRDQEVFNEYAPKVWKMSHDAPGFLREILVLFMKNTWHTRNALIFRGRNEEEKKLAVKYLKFLKTIGIGKKQAPVPEL